MHQDFANTFIEADMCPWKLIGDYCAFRFIFSSIKYMVPGDRNSAAFWTCENIYKFIYWLKASNQMALVPSIKPIAKFDTTSKSLESNMHEISFIPSNAFELPLAKRFAVCAVSMCAQRIWQKKEFKPDIEMSAFTIIPPITVLS